METAMEFACVAMENFVEGNARNEWVEQMKWLATHPTLANRARQKDAWVQSGIMEKWIEMENVATSTQGHALELNSESDVT